ncbi:ATP-binding protein [Flavilitoribacter nigricans]|uniref:histidine kinase n=1 Tax=Flavilitoribacter nigricans (strain ATCC 23147 / DSM 23189 / NBRC 102662 / NCIMB 1420 / SS-2) TaxID=1122177 RepID=A0A2D0N1Z4_FLAN2|nr:ATP-binding protein [Flavilitoribacter nigricans]PHN02562.1 hypothetical protein CRP01_31805 [Flavilitoribacter nigricans DSM 23189 = NBRC 102662]
MRPNSDKDKKIRCRPVKWWLSILLLLLLQRPFAQVQTPGISIKKFDAADGLDFAGFKALTKDSLGILWLLGEDQRSFGDLRGFQMGMFDGVRFQSRPLDTLEGLSNYFEIPNIYDWGANRLLIGSSSGDHLYYYDIGQKKVVEILYQSKPLTGLRRGQVWRGRYYFIFENQGVPTLAVLEGTQVKLLFSAEKLEDSIYLYPVEKGIWTCASLGLTLFDFSGNILANKPFSQSLGLFYANQQTARGIEFLPLNAPPFYLDTQSREFKPLPHPELDKPGLASSVFKDQHGNLLYIFAHPYNLKHAYLLTKEGTLFDLSAVSETIPQVSNIYGDDFLQSFWVVNGFNLYKVQLSGTSVAQYLLTSGMRKIRLGSDGKLYASTETGGTFVSELNRQLAFRSLDQNVFVRHFEIDDNGDVFTNSDRIFKHVRKGVEQEISLFNFPYDIVPISDSLLLASSASGAEIISKYPLSSELLSGIRFESTHQIVPTGGSGVFVGYKDGAAAFDLTSRQTRKVFTGEAITSMLRENSDTWWFGSYEGRLYRHSSAETDTMLQVGTPIVSITKDGNERLWLGTFNGVYVYEIERENLFKIDDQLLTHTECNRLSAFYDAKFNRMLIGTVRGLNVIDIDQVNLSRKQLRLHLSFLHYFNTNTGKTDTLELKNTTDHSLQLDAYHRNVTVGFAPGIGNEDACQYYYALLPSDRDLPQNIEWRSNGSNAEISLTNLESGAYHLLIMAKTDYSEMESNPLTIHIVVADYFYNRWWFYLLVMAVLAGGVLWWQRRLRTENIRLENEVEKRTVELRRDKETIQRQAEELTQLDEMKTRFYNNISHELKTPLSLIVAPLESIERGNYITDKKGNEFLNLISKNASLLQERVEELLELSRLEHRKISVHNNPVDLADFVENNCRIFQQSAEQSGIVLNISIKTAYEQLIFDEKKVGKIIHNLIANALKYCPRGSQVNVLVEASPTLLRLIVADDGPGIPVEHQSRIFEKFYQVPGDKQSNPGSGIGLSIVKEYVDLMGGTVELQSAEDTGTKFEISIPAGEAPVSPKEEMAVPALEPVMLAKEEKAHLLVVEDNEDLRQFLSMLLSERFHLTLAANGLEATRLLENGLPADLILSDIMMPEMDGMALLDRVKRDETLRKLPFIFLTAKQNEVSKLSALRLGVDDYLTKPFSERELLVRIQRLLQNYGIRKAALAESGPEPIAIAADSEQVFALQSFVQEKLTDPTFSVAMIAEKMNMSARNLQRFMQREVGMSPKEFIMEVQMHLLRELRNENQELSLRDLAGQVGYSDHKYMSRMFFERFGYRL